MSSFSTTDIIDGKQKFIIDEAKLLATQLKKYYDAVRELNVSEEALRETESILTIPLCKVVQMIVRDLGKVGEIVYAHKNAHKGLRVVDSKHGADLTNDATGENMELKTTIYLASKPTRAATFGFPVGPLNLGVVQRREHMIRALECKTKGLGICMEVVDYKGDTIQEYKLSHLFSIEFFKRVTINDKTMLFAISTAMCRHCFVMHRPNKLAYYSGIFDKAGSLTEEQWRVVFESTVRQCKGARKDKEW